MNINPIAIVCENTQQFRDFKDSNQELKNVRIVTRMEDALGFEFSGMEIIGTPRGYLVDLVKTRIRDFNNG